MVSYGHRQYTFCWRLLVFLHDEFAASPPPGSWYAHVTPGLPPARLHGRRKGAPCSLVLPCSMAGNLYNSSALPTGVARRAWRTAAWQSRPGGYRRVNVIFVQGIFASSGEGRLPRFCYICCLLLPFALNDVGIAGKSTVMMMMMSMPFLHRVGKFCLRAFFSRLLPAVQEIYRACPAPGGRAGRPAGAYLPAGAGRPRRRARALPPPRVHAPARSSYTFCSVLF